MVLSDGNISLLDLPEMSDEALEADSDDLMCQLAELNKNRRAYLRSGGALVRNDSDLNMAEFSKDENVLQVKCKHIRFELNKRNNAKLASDKFSSIDCG